MPSPAASKLQERHIAAARRRVAHLAALSRATDDAEAKIAEAAEKRLEQVEADLAKARRRAATSPEAARAVEDLTLERGHLQRVLSQAAERRPAT